MTLPNVKLTLPLLQTAQNQQIVYGSQRQVVANYWMKPPTANETLTSFTNFSISVKASKSRSPKSTTSEKQLWTLHSLLFQHALWLILELLMSLNLIFLVIHTASHSYCYYFYFLHLAINCHNMLTRHQFIFLSFPLCFIQKPQ